MVLRREGFGWFNGMISLMLWGIFIYYLANPGIQSAIWILLTCIFAVINTVLFFRWVAQTPLAKETEAEIQELAKWLVESGYMPFYGTVIYTEEINSISFETDGEYETFSQTTDANGDHGNYHYWDRGKYRTVRFHGKNARHYVKI